MLTVIVITGTLLLSTCSQQTASIAGLQIEGAYEPSEERTCSSYECDEQPGEEQEEQTQQFALLWTNSIQAQSMIKSRDRTDDDEEDDEELAPPPPEETTLPKFDLQSRFSNVLAFLAAPPTKEQSSQQTEDEEPVDEDFYQKRQVSEEVLKLYQQNQQLEAAKYKKTQSDLDRPGAFQMVPVEAESIPDTTATMIANNWVAILVIMTLILANM